MAKKKIKILTTGPIRAKSFINGPVLTPFMEDTANIFTMVSQGVHVVEVCEDGSEVRLTLNNFADDNSKASVEAKKAIQAEIINNMMNNEEPTVNEEVIPETVEEVKEDNVESEVTEPVVEEKNEEVIENEIIPEVKEEEVKAEPEKVQEPKPSYQNNYKNNNYNNKHNKHKNNNYKNNNGIRVESADSIKIGN